MTEKKSVDLNKLTEDNEIKDLEERLTKALFEHDLVHAAVVISCLSRDYGHNSYAQQVITDFTPTLRLYHAFPDLPINGSNLGKFIVSNRKKFLGRTVRELLLEIMVKGKQKSPEFREIKQALETGKITTKNTQRLEDRAAKMGLSSDIFGGSLPV